SMPILSRMAGPLLLGCQDVAKAYGTRTLFERVSFGIFDGDRACLVGPHGSGKSTLLKILAGFETPDQGTRAVHGRLRVGYVAQDPTFDESLTVETAIEAVLDHVDPDEGPGRVALGPAGLADREAPVDALSGGWRKRLAIARELAAGPDVLLMDEPTNHLDVDRILWLGGLRAERARG